VKGAGAGTISRFQNSKISKKTASTFLHRQFFVAPSFKGKGYKVKGERGWRRKNLKISKFKNSKISKKPPVRFCTGSSLLHPVFG
jgi:hypothetical protein